ncbi:hypothetical protein IWX49DRAFT_585173 [Phyllosticta citricarpa]
MRSRSTRASKAVLLLPDCSVSCCALTSSSATRVILERSAAITVSNIPRLHATTAPRPTSTAHINASRRYTSNQPPPSLSIQTWFPRTSETRLKVLGLCCPNCSMPSKSLMCRRRRSRNRSSSSSWSICWTASFRNPPLPITNSSSSSSSVSPLTTTTTA